MNRAHTASANTQTATKSNRVKRSKRN